jgi:hypothetical protein
MCFGETGIAGERTEEQVHAIASGAEVARVVVRKIEFGAVGRDAELAILSRRAGGDQDVFQMEMRVGTAAPIHDSAHQAVAAGVPRQRHVGEGHRAA